MCLFQPECKCLESGNIAECPQGCRGRQTEARDSLRLLAEIHFINAEVCCLVTLPFVFLIVTLLCILNASTVTHWKDQKPDRVDRLSTKCHFYNTIGQVSLSSRKSCGQWMGHNLCFWMLLTSARNGKICLNRSWERRVLCWSAGVWTTIQ